MDEQDQEIKPLFVSRDPWETLKIAAEEIARTPNVSRDCRIGFCGVFFDHATGGITYCVFNFRNADVAYSRLHDVANMIKQHAAQEMARQAQGRIVVPGAPGAQR